jgi:hypothetical protein
MTIKKVTYVMPRQCPRLASSAGQTRCGTATVSHPLGKAHHDGILGDSGVEPQDIDGVMAVAHVGGEHGAYHRAGSRRVLDRDPAATYPGDEQVALLDNVLDDVASETQAMDRFVAESRSGDKRTTLLEDVFGDTTSEPWALDQHIVGARYGIGHVTVNTDVFGDPM